MGQKSSEHFHSSQFSFQVSRNHRKTWKLKFLLLPVFLIKFLGTSMVYNQLRNFLSKKQTKKKKKIEQFFIFPPTNSSPAKTALENWMIIFSFFLLFSSFWYIFRSEEEILTFFALFCWKHIFYISDTG